MNSSIPAPRFTEPGVDEIVREEAIKCAADVFSQMYFGAKLADLPEAVRPRASKLLLERARRLDTEAVELDAIAAEISKIQAAGITSSCAPAASV